MDVILFNTLTGAYEKVVPQNDREVRMYHCGPTVYDYAHIGNLRSFIVNDVLRRTLAYAGYEVKQVMNITDIDDKMIDRAHREHLSIKELAQKYTDFFLADLHYLNILTPHQMPRATEHIGGMITMIEKLLREDYAYKTTDGVYFDVSKSLGYGELAHIDLFAETQSRMTGEDKKNKRDFALWKFETPEDHGNAYDASFGRGRPGWHIECSEMSRGTLGETIDIHTGGVDLVFPHHTNEIAQSEAVSKKLFVHIWVHNEFVMINGQKMSKSLGNHTTLKTITEKGFSPQAFRYWVLGTHYRSKANFTYEALEGAENALRKLNSHISEEMGTPNESYRMHFLELMVNDLDTPRALALAWDVAKDQNLTSADKTATLLNFDEVLGLGLAHEKKEAIPDHIIDLAKKRDDARAEKDWAGSDRLRDQIKALGFEVMDTPQGQKLSKI